MRNKNLIFEMINAELNVQNIDKTSGLYYDTDNLRHGGNNDVYI